MAYDIMIIGAGPAGMSAAIRAGDAGLHVLLIEGANQIGKKILVTGNGRCNLTNERQDLSFYRSEDPSRVEKILEQFDLQKTYHFFRHLGIMIRKKNGYVYPYNEQAAAVREAFECKIRSYQNINIVIDCHVDQVKIKADGYELLTSKERYQGHSLIVSTGGYAGPKIGCDGSGYAFAKSFGHYVVKPLPALTPLKSPAPFLKKISGVRNQAMIHLLVNGEEFTKEEGELQWTDYGISGVAIFQISRFAVLALEEGKKVSLVLDFLPEVEKERYFQYLCDFRKNGSFKNANQLLAGILPAKLVPVVLREARIEPSFLAGKLTDEMLLAIVDACKNFLLHINGYLGYEKAQVTRGGIRLKELNSSLESIYHPGLFFAGEVIDVDGTCGGYNLQWAFSSGNVAGMAACHYVENRKKKEKISTNARKRKKVSKKRKES